jgi:Ser-tRNA(Ala) deacylase AlaX
MSWKSQLIKENLNFKISPMDIKEQYEELTKKLQQSLPIKAYPTRELVQSIRDKENPITLKSELTITTVHNSGDISGIMCVIEQKNKNVIACGLTHLIFMTDCPLYKEIVDYQKKRNKRVKLLGMN